MHNNSATYNDAWQNCLSQLRLQTSAEEFTKWFLPIVPLEFDGTMLRLRVPSKSFAEEIENNYIRILRPLIAETFGQQTRIRYAIPKSDVQAQIQSESNASVSMPSFATMQTNTANIRNPFIIPGINKLRIDPQLNKNYTFSNFIEESATVLYVRQVCP